MTIDSVRAFLAAHAPDIQILETDDSTATVDMAAAGHGVAPAQIAKTLSLRIKDRTILVVTSGTARLNNRKIKDVLGGKPRMLAEGIRRGCAGGRLDALRGAHCATAHGRARERGVDRRLRLTRTDRAATATL
jgi:hypothetical protein